MNIRQTSETVEIAIFLALSGGLMDAYSYICRGGVFANAQTGNMLLFGVHLSQANFSETLKYLSPVLFFSIGILLSEIIKHLFENKKTSIHWRQFVILIEIFFFIIVAFIPFNHNLLANNLTSFVCGMQVEAFRKFHGSGAATTMCIGNLRSANENLYIFFKKKEKIYFYRTMLYYFIIVCFVIGAVIGNFLIKSIGRYAILSCVIILGIPYIMMNKESRKTILNL